MYFIDNIFSLSANILRDYCHVSTWFWKNRITILWLGRKWICIKIKVLIFFYINTSELLVPANLSHYLSLLFNKEITRIYIWIFQRWRLKHYAFKRKIGTYFMNDFTKGLTILNRLTKIHDTLLKTYLLLLSIKIL